MTIGWNHLPFYTRVAIGGLLVFALIYAVFGVAGVSEDELIDLVGGFIIYALFLDTDARYRCPGLEGRPS